MKILVPEQKSLFFETRFPVRWGDLDALGHVNSCKFFVYMEVARLAWFDEIGIPVRASSEGVVVANSFCSYLRQIHFPAQLCVSLYVSDVKQKSFETWYTLTHVDKPDEVLAEGGATIVWVDFTVGRAKGMPQRLYESLLHGNALP